MRKPGVALTELVILTRSKSQKRTDEKERKRRSPSPKPTKLHLGRLTRNVTKVQFKISVSLNLNSDVSYSVTSIKYVKIFFIQIKYTNKHD